MNVSVTIVRAGMLTTVQDLGRWGFQAYGVPVGGAMDPLSHRRANRLVGNPDDDATLEVTLIGPHVRFDRACAFAVSGANFQLALDGGEVSGNRMVEAKAGAVLSFGERRAGARAYLAVAGGLDVAKVLGSRSTHTISQMGGYQGRALRAGDVIPVGEPRPLAKGPAQAGHDRFPNTLRIIPADEKLAAALTTQRFRVSVSSNRMGYRLEGARVAQPPAGELISTAMPTGAIQVPPSGEPILLMNDHATTGGYAIAGVVIAADLWIAGQLAPGDSIDFEACDIAEARAEQRRQETELAAG